jgi:hypothetical protein
MRHAKVCTPEAYLKKLVERVDLLPGRGYTVTSAWPMRTFRFSYFTYGRFFWWEEAARVERVRA